MAFTTTSNQTPTKPSTIFARWSSQATGATAVNPQSALTLLIRKLNSTVNQRRAVQIRPFRLPPSAIPSTANVNGKVGKKEDVGRNMYVVRVLNLNSEHTMAFVEDPAAPLRSEVAASKAASVKGKEKETAASPDDDVVIMDDVPAPSLPPPPSTSSGPKDPAHTRWTCSTVGGVSPISTHYMPFDAFLQRVLLGGASSANQAGSGGAWVGRSAALSVEGVMVASGDWEVKLGTVVVKGGTAAGSSKGMLVEATYLPVSHLPTTSNFLREYISSLFPPQAIASGEVEFIELPREAFFEASLDGSDVKGEERQDWTEKHSALAYVHIFKKEGLL